MGDDSVPIPKRTQTESVLLGCLFITTSCPMSILNNGFTRVETKTFFYGNHNYDSVFHMWFG